MPRLTTLLGTLLAMTAMLAIAGCADEALNLAIPPQARADGPDYNGEDPLADDDDDDMAGDDDDGGGSDVAELLNIDPAPGSSDHHYRRPITIAFTSDASGVSFGLFSSGGPVDHEITWNTDWTLCSITPLPRLEPDTTYSVEVDLYGQGQAWTFTTSSVGLLQIEQATLDEATFALDTSAASVLAPAGLAALNSTAAFSGTPAVSFLFSDPGTWTRFSMRTGLFAEGGETWEQDFCAGSEAIDVDDDFQLERAFFTASGETMSFYLGSTLVQAESAWIEGDFGPTGETLVEVQMSGWLASESLDALTGQDGCGLLGELLSTTCEPCPSSDGQCAWFSVVGLSGARTDVPLEEVSASTIDNCDGGGTTWLGCSSAGGGAPSPQVLLLLTGLLGIGAVRRRIC